MSIKAKLSSIALASALALGVSATANAAPIVQTFGPAQPTAGGPGGSFSNVFTFNAPADGKLSVVLTSTDAGGLTNVNFLGAGPNLNGVKLTAVSTGVNELYQIIKLPVLAGISTLTVNGSAQQLGTYSGSFTFAVPEPQTWALMILGFGVIGYSLRRRQSKVAVAA